MIPPLKWNEIHETFLSGKDTYYLSLSHTKNGLVKARFYDNEFCSLIICKKKKETFQLEPVGITHTHTHTRMARYLGKTDWKIFLKEKDKEIRILLSQ